MTIGNRGLAGQPTLPYIDYRSYAGVDVFLDVTFLDYTGVQQIPSAITYQVDDLTNAVNLIPATSVTPIGSSMLVQLPGSQMIMSRQYQGSQLCQVTFSATLPPVTPQVIVPLASNISLLLHGDQTPLIDSSNYQNVMTATVDAVFETAVFKFGPGAISFPDVLTPSTVPLSTPVGANGPLDILPQGSDFTIDGWFYLPAHNANTAFFFDYGDDGVGNREFAFGATDGAPGLYSLLTNISGWTGANAPVTVTTGAWHYFAIVRKGSTSSNGAFFLDTARASSPMNWSAAYTPPVNPQVNFGRQPGATGNPTAPFYLDEVRVIKGTALYDPSSTTITPPTAPTTNTIIPASAAPIVKSVTIIELCSIQTPGGMSP